MDQLISHSVQFKQGRAMFITSLSLASEALSSGMPIFHGLEQLFMDPLSSSLRDVYHTHFPNHSKKFPSFLVIQTKFLFLLFLSFFLGLVYVAIIYPFKRVYIKHETFVLKCRGMVESRHRDSNQPSHANRIGTKCF